MDPVLLIGRYPYSHWVLGARPGGIESYRALPQLGVLSCDCGNIGGSLWLLRFITATRRHSCQRSFHRNKSTDPAGNFSAAGVLPGTMSRFTAPSCHSNNSCINNEPTFIADSVQSVPPPIIHVFYITRKP